MKLRGKNDSPGMKRFWSSGKEVSFELPESWRGKKEDEGSVFFDPAYKRAELRVSVWTFPCEDTMDPLQVPFLSSAMQAGGEMEQLAPAHWLYRFHLRSVLSLYHLVFRGRQATVAIFVADGFSADVLPVLEHGVRAARIVG